MKPITLRPRDDGQRYDQRDADGCERDRDQNGVDETDHGDPADVAGQRGVDARAELLRVVPAALAEQLHHPRRYLRRAGSPVRR
jgi:hypothetical protein